MQENERRGLPDGWIHDQAGWALLIESKVSASPDPDQIRRHLRMAERRGVTEAHLLWLTVTPVRHATGSNVTNRTWSDLYEWLTDSRRKSEWARRAAAYFEVAEVQADMKQQLKTGTLTRFTGIPFDADNPYSYSQAKRVLGLLRDRLAARADLRKQLGADESHPGRGAIKARKETTVWDFVALKDLRGSTNFTKHPHLTLGITESQLQAYVTIPNRIQSRVRTQMLGPTYDDFLGLIRECTRRLEKALVGTQGATPFFVVVHRRYASMAAIPVVDMRLAFDPRTAFRGRHGKGQPRYQPEWLMAAYEALRHRRSNLQFQIGATFSYGSCGAVRRAGIQELVAKAWIACRPLIEAGRERKAK